MLNAVHKQVLASKLADMFASSPLVLVYQVIGNVQSAALATQLRKQLDAAHPGHGLQPQCLRIKNTVGALNRQLGLSSYLRANNLLLGWQLPGESALHAMHASTHTDLLDLLTPRGRQGQSQAQGRPRTPTAPPQTLALPHSLLAPALKYSLQVTDSQPVALLAAFYQGKPVGLRHLRHWTELDATAVVAQLLTQVDEASGAVLIAQMEQLGQALAETCDLLVPQELIYLLDNRAADVVGSERERCA